MEYRRSNLKLALGAGCALAVLAAATMASAEERTFSVASTKATDAIPEFARQAGIQIVAPAERLKGLSTPAVEGRYDTREALAMLIQGTGLHIASDDGRTVMLSADPQSGSAAGDGAEQGTVQALVVTAQKREENIQDVPIAMSAFTQEDLTRSQVAGGPDLVTQIPNMTFTKTNFSSYSIQIRGIGTQAISATTDPAVAVAFNNTPFVRNRFFEQEFYDLERVEVLRGPQGTLYGRNATGGVVNIISAKPKFRYEARLSADLGNYSSSRLEGMVNIPLVEDKAALRLAGAWTKRDGYAVNQLTGHPIDGRDLWSTRVSLRVQPTDRLNATLIWEHFQEDDDRLRSGKQLCKKDVVTDVAGFHSDNYFQTLRSNGQGSSYMQADFSQGCTRASLYSDEVYQTPNGLALPYYIPLGMIGLPTALNDPYLNSTQSRDLRVIESTVEPDYRANANLAELQVKYDVSDAIGLTSETAYSVDEVFSLQDFNRFTTAPGAWTTTGLNSDGIIAAGILSPDGVFCDPQIGCTDRLLAVDISAAKASQFSEELRLASIFDGPFNFSLGANFLRADSLDKYYVFINSLSMMTAIYGFGGTQRLNSGGHPYVSGVTDNMECLNNGPVPSDPNAVYPVLNCAYMDPNPIGSLNDAGHNYFLSNNPYKLVSYAVFGEAYYNILDNLKLTLGLRWTVDKKEAPRVPTWLVVGESYGYPVAEVLDQEWREPTGRLALDWKPNLSFTDQTLIYASLAHGYKAGGANPPTYVYSFYAQADAADVLRDHSATRPTTFKPEFVNAFEFGSKNTLLDGELTLNLAAFYYNYNGYQISEIVDRSAFNRNFDATVWGVELESEWRPTENIKLGLKGGYEATRIGNGQRAVDLMDRTAGDPRWVVSRPFPTFASNCILPAWLFVGHVDGDPQNPELVNMTGLSGGGNSGCEYAYAFGYDPVTQRPFDEHAAPTYPYTAPINYTAWSADPNDYPGAVWPDGVVADGPYPGWDPSTAPNQGEGIAKPLGGNQLPNAPHWTATVTGDYTLPLRNEWLLTLHSDVHWQSQSWWRVFNDSTYDKLHPYFTMNLAAILTNDDQGWNIMAYIKNVTDETAITGAFLNSDDTGLTTNVFLTEPRLYGLRVTKNWSGGPLLGTFGARHEGPYPFSIEIGGQVQRPAATGDRLEPGFTDALPASVNTLDNVQGRDFDWGDGRSVKLTWRPSPGPWSVWAQTRFGKTNKRDEVTASLETAEACGAGGNYSFFCTYFPHANIYHSETDWSAVKLARREDHTVVDFAVGRDAGLGTFSHSTLSGGLRYARLESKSSLQTDAVPDWLVPEGWFLPGVPATHTRYASKLSGDRTLEGAGPALNWDASLPLLGSDESGWLQLDWSLSGGVLFGRQEVSISGAESSNSYAATGFYVFSHYVTPSLVTTKTAVEIRRGKRVSVPTAGAGVGLSYSVDRLKVGAGYRWERYFNAIDGGFNDVKKEDRTFDGPYFKIAVGFGG